MKFIIGLILSLNTVLAFACPNLSGEYFSEASGTYYAIEQDGCETLRYIYDDGADESFIDGQERLTHEYDISVEEGKILAHVSFYESALWKGNKLINNIRYETLYTDGKKYEEKVIAETFLNKDLDLVTLSKGSNGTEKVIDRRMK